MSWKRLMNAIKKENKLSYLFLKFAILNFKEKISAIKAL